MDYYLVSKLISLGLSMLYLPIIIFVWFKYKESYKREMEYLDYLARRIDAVERSISRKD